MARPAWTEIADATCDLDSPGKEDSLFKALRDNAAVARVSVFGVDIVEDTTTTGSPSWDTVNNSTFRLEIPDIDDYTGIERTVTLTIKCKVTSGTTGAVRLYNSTDATGGDSVAVTATGYTDTTIDVVVDAWVGTTPTFVVQFQRTAGAGSVYVAAELSMTGRLEY